MPARMRETASFYPQGMQSFVAEVGLPPAGLSDSTHDWLLGRHRDLESGEMMQKYIVLESYPA
ncbi:hypothetical protein PDIDSM_5174 [Penicillium digitatum]|nr:hypothetical protein PDIDSM_5174 [Penicillium digitatum]